MMAKVLKTRGSRARPEPSGITELQVAGFKSISQDQNIEIRPLTILAGTNSSGKSSMVQPLLLLKQTLEAAYDPGPLLLNGPNVKFTSAEQLLSRIGRGHSSDTFSIGIRLNTGDHLRTFFRKEHKQEFRIEQMERSGDSGTLTFFPEMSPSEIVKTGITQGMESLQEGMENGEWRIMPARCFLALGWAIDQSFSVTFRKEAPREPWPSILGGMIHLPSLRANPERVYPVTAIGPSYPGTFDVPYTASIISQWQAEHEDSLTSLNADLKLLRLTGGVTAVRVNGVEIELHVGRLPDLLPARPEDRVNIADVGVGVSQTLPVLVALHAARPGQLVYVEQPETHLHPQAQFDLAQILAAAAKRGVRVVVETHSTLLLLGVQTLVSEGSLDPNQVKLHWFMRGKDGRTTVQPGDLDAAGRFGDWPEDFDDVTLRVQKRYLDAADKRMFAP